MPYFEQKYHVILPTAEAQGKSVDKGDSLSYEMITDDLNALLSKRCISTLLRYWLERWRYRWLTAGNTASRTK